MVLVHRYEIKLHKERWQLIREKIYDDFSSRKCCFELTCLHKPIDFTKKFSERVQCEFMLKFE
jgi:hypothetical protein